MIAPKPKKTHSDLYIRYYYESKGMSIERISNGCHMSRPDIIAALRRAGIKGPLRSDKEHGLTDDHIRRLIFDHRMSLRRLCKSKGISPANLKDDYIRVLNPQQRLEVTKAAHAASRGRRVSEEEAMKRSVPRSSKVLSSYEAHALSVLQKAGLIPIPSYPISRYSADLAFPASKLNVEIGEGTWHSSLKKSRQDTVKMNALAAMGWTTMRFQVGSIDSFDWERFVSAVRNAIRTCCLSVQQQEDY